MAILSATTKITNGNYTVNRNTLSASDTLAYVAGNHQHLELYNTTGSLVTVTLTGSGSTTISPVGYGGTISVSGGKAIAVAANTTVSVDLDAISAFLLGVVTITGGVGIVAHLYNN